MGKTRFEPVSPAPNEVPQYNGLPDLRQALTADEANRRAEAYSAVLEHDIPPEDVLSANPPKDALQDAGVIPDSGPEMPAASEDRQEKLQLLREIRDLLAGGGA